MVNKIIANYLSSGKRLQIPQFGAFIHKEGDGAVVFVPFLKKDDGVLVDVLRRDYGLDEADARGVIAEYIEQVTQTVASRGSYAIEGVGDLKADANGAFFLETASGAQAPAASAPATPAAPVAQPAPASAAATTPRPEPLRSAYPAPGAPSQASAAQAPQTGARQPAAEPLPGTVRPQPTPAAPAPAQPQRPATTQGTVPPRPAQPAAAQPAAAPSAPAQPSVPRPAQPAPAPQSGMPGSYSASGSTSYGSRPGAPGGMPPRSGMPQRPAPKAATKSDKFMVIAILAAIVALASIIYGVVASSDGPEFSPFDMPERHTPATDSLATDSAAVQLPGTNPAR